MTDPIWRLRYLGIVGTTNFDRFVELPVEHGRFSS